MDPDYWIGIIGNLNISNKNQMGPNPNGPLGEVLELLDTQV